MSFTFDEIAVEFLNWTPRLEQRVTQWPSTKSLTDLFTAYLRRARPAQNAEDVATAAKVFASRPTMLQDWYGHAIGPFDDALTFRAGAPSLAVGALARWRRLSTKLDGEGLVAWRLARDARAGISSSEILCNLPNWGTYLGVHDRGLEQVLGRGLADSHVHIEACDPIPLLWLRIMVGEVRIDHLRSYMDEALANLAEDVDTFQRRQREKTMVADAVRLRSELEIGLSGYQALGPLDPTAVPLPLEGRRAAFAERSLLVAAWRAVRSGDLEIAALLDRYLAAKSAFGQRHLQAAGNGLGLMRFREFLDRGETIQEQRLKKRSNRVRHERYKRMLALASEAPSLSKLELRVAPFKSVKDWAWFGRLWADRFAGKPPFDKINTAFLVHFIREADPSPSLSVDMHFGRLREKLDRMSAVFQSFRHTHPALARHIVGVDVANLERGCPPEVFVPYLKLLRGTRQVAPHDPHPAFAHWERLAEIGYDGPHAELAQLGLTYHAGEDFHHPLDGLRAIAGLLDNILEAGDRLGHGLAAGWDIRRFDSTRRLGPVPQGIVLDDLVWLRRTAQAHGVWSGRPSLAVDRAITDLSYRVYGQYPPAHELDKAIDLRFRMPSRRWKDESPAHGLVYMDTYNEKTIGARAAFASDDDMAVLSGLSDEITWAQTVVIESVRSRGVTIEANPSSNLATGTVDSLHEHPYFRYVDCLAGCALTSFNTDDPGLFGTRTDVEYALMFEAMLKNGIDRSRALEMLDAARRTGIEQSFVPTLVTLR